MIARTPKRQADHSVVLLREIEVGAASIEHVYPDQQRFDDEIPERARNYLTQARDSLHAPDGSVMLAASSVDAMLKSIGLTAGSLYSRIERAKTEGRITPDMADWAHQVRLDANDPRHADLNDPHHTQASARLALDFATAFAEILFVLPARVTRGRNAAAGIISTN
ncbi:DUF4145 domain-containing protein [Belnapia sp. T6]|uniref:DUF4145 domain-containing protein n=1 Tax=Belnapia mucosa TaxID=2804532 RepID=A0ABS1VD24_9PROT|nr:DUF4145 domain-containing protein [Belnapia mucosa]MBL6458629.1 DUF4145 domain-containing protein [Belnapia mucosa]